MRLLIVRHATAVPHGTPDVPEDERPLTPRGDRYTTGEVLGTPYYIAPEQIKAQKDIDIRADLYSLGCMLHEWLAGTRPFDGASVVEILSGHVKGAAPA